MDRITDPNSNIQAGYQISVEYRADHLPGCLRLTSFNIIHKCKFGYNTKFKATFCNNPVGSPKKLRHSGKYSL